MKALIVDDDFTSRCWLRGLVKKFGFSVAAEASNGEEAIEAATRTQPDVVLLDVSMPVLTGPKALPAILSASPDSRVVMLTSIADEATVMECLEAGAAGYIRKDSPPDEISRLLAELSEEITTQANDGGVDVRS